MRSKKESEEDLQPFDQRDAETYRRAVCILMCIAHDRSDVQWAIGESAKEIKSPIAGG